MTPAGSLVQGALRFGRALDFALRCTTVFICINITTGGSGPPRLLGVRVYTSIIP